MVAKSSRPLLFVLFTAGLILILVIFSPLRGARADEGADLRDRIWAKERGLYAGRGAGTMNPYIAETSSAYLAWPPFAKAPFGATGLKATRSRVAGSGERLTLSLMGFTRSHDTAIIYYATHRTALADGTPVDQSYENIHVWSQEDGTWRLLGGMARLAPAHEP